MRTSAAGSNGHLVVLVLMSSLLLLAASGAHAQGYLTILDPSGPAPGLTFRPRAIADSVFVGDVRLPDGTERGYMVNGCVYGAWTCPARELWTPLGTLGGNASEAVSVTTLYTRNPDWTWTGHPVIVGMSQAANGQWHAYVWRDGVMRALDDDGANDSVAVDIGDGGRIVGTVRQPDGTDHIAVWNSSGVMDVEMGSLPGERLVPVGIREHDTYFRVAGTKVLANGRDRAFTWDRYGVQDLGTLGGPAAHVNAMTQYGDIVGAATNASGIWRAFIIDPGDATMRDLGRLTGVTSHALGIDAYTQNRRVVGHASTSGPRYHAFLWTPENGMVDLNDLIPPDSGWELTTAYAMQGRFILARGVRDGVEQPVILRNDNRPTWTNGRLSVTAVTTTSVTLTWSGAHGVFGIEHYYVWADDRLMFGPRDHSSMVVTGLTPGHTYRFRVEAFDGTDYESYDGPTIDVRTYSEGPDLSVMLVSGAAFAFHGTYQIRAVTENRGNRAAGPSTTRLYFVNSAGGWYVAGDQPLPALNALTTITTYTSVRTDVVPAGTYRLMGCADAFGAVAEWTETDNCWLSDATVTVIPPRGLAITSGLP